MQTILVPLDGSELANQIVPYVQVLGQTLAARIHLLCVISGSQRRQFFEQNSHMPWTTNEAPLPEQASEPDERMLSELRAYGERIIEQQASSLRQVGLTVETEVIFGSPAACIIELLDTRQIDMIAMVTHGYSGLRRWALGSVTDKVVQAASKPLFIVRGREPDRPAPAPAMKRILVPLDGSTLSQQALPVATWLASRAGAELHLLRAVLPPVRSYPAVRLAHQPASHYETAMAATRQRATDELQATADELRATGLSVSMHVAVGYAEEVIIEEAAQQQSDVIVMATHGYSGIQRWSLGSVADKVLHATATPLVLVRARNS